MKASKWESLHRIAQIVFLRLPDGQYWNVFASLLPKQENPPTHVVNEHEDDVGPFFARSTKSTQQKLQQKKVSEPREKAHFSDAGWKRMKIAQ